MYQCQEPDVYFLRGWTQPLLVEFRLLSQRKGNLGCRNHTWLLLCWSQQGRQAISGWGVCVSETLCLPETLQLSLLWLGLFSQVRFTTQLSFCAAAWLCLISWHLICLWFARHLANLKGTWLPLIWLLCGKSSNIHIYNHEQVPKEEEYRWGQSTASKSIFNLNMFEKSLEKKKKEEENRECIMN